MALGTSAISVRFAGGVDTKTDAKQVPTTKLLRLENAVFTKAVSLVKRNGYEALPRETTDGSVYPDLVSVGVRNDEMVGFSSDAAWSFMESLQKWRRIGAAFSFVQTERTVAKTGTEQTAGDHATANGVSVYAWEDSRGGIWYAAADAATGHIAVQARQLSATGVRPRCARCGDVLHVYWAETASSRVFSAVVNPDDLAAIPTPQSLLTDVTSDVIYDAEYVELFNSPVVAWVTATGYRVGYVASSGLLGTISTGYPNPSTVTITSPLRIAVASNPREGETAPLGVMYATASSIVCRGHDSFLSLNPSTSPVTVSAYSGTVTGITGAWQRDEVATDVYRLWVAWGIDGGGDVRDRVVFSTSFDSDESVGVTVQLQRGSDLASRAFRAGAHVLAHVVHDVEFFSTYFAISLSTEPMTIASRILPGVAGNAPVDGHLASVVYDADNEDLVHWIAGYSAQLDSADGDQFAETGLQLVTYNVASDQSHRSVQLGQSLYVSGAMPMLYDSAVIGEAGIHYAADGPIVTATAVGGSLTPETTVSYQIVYEAILANGEIMPGPVSVAVIVPLPAGRDRVSLTIPTYRHTAWPNVRIGVFRSEGDDGNAQPARYRVTSLDPGDTTGSNRYLRNDPTTDTVTFVDDLSDVDLLAREPLYTNGGILSNDAIPATSVLARGKSRIFASDPHDPDLVRFSQEVRDGYAAEFSPDLSVKVDAYGGRVSALAVLDDSVVVFKETAIYFFAGPGPLANPDAGSGFSQPALITADVGCAAPRSIAYTPVGIVFQSPKGIYLLDRGRQVRYIGAPVEAYRDIDVVAATLIDKRTQIRFLLGTGDVSLLYDYYFDQWSTFTNHLGRDAVLVAETYNYVRTDGTIYREISGYTDNGIPVYSLIETAEIRMQETLQGMQRVWWVLVIGAYISPHTLQVRFATDYERGWSSAFVYDPSTTRTATVWGSGVWGAGPWGGSIEERYQFQIHIGEKCESIRLRFEDRPDVDEPGAAFELSELLVIGGVRKPDYRPLGEGRTH